MFDNDAIAMAGPVPIVRTNDPSRQMRVTLVSQMHGKIHRFSLP